MNADDRKMALLDGLRLERKTPGKVLSGKRISIALLAACSILVGAALLYDNWSASTISVRAATATAAAEGTGSLLDASGYVVARRQATLSAKILGKLVEVPFEEGGRVTEGQVVARLDDSNYAAALIQSKASALAAQASLVQAQAAFADAAPNYERYRTLLAQGAMSAEAVDGQKTIFDATRTAVGIAERNLAVARAMVAVAQANENDTIVRAPFAGVVTDKAAQPGEIVAPAAAGGGFTRTGIATIVDMDSLEVQVDVSESYIDRVHSGQKATVRLNAYPDWDIPGSVIAIIPTADETKGSVKVRLGIAVRDRRILPQMGAHVAFLANQAPRAIGVTIPASAIIRRKDGQVVFVIGDDNRVLLRFVEADAARNGAAIVSTGLAPGERVAWGDVHKLRDGSKVKVEP
jgi:RND family efflux transporter MFP subunit